MRNLLQAQHLTKVYALEFFALWIILDLYEVLSLLGAEVAPVIETRLEEFLSFRSLEKPSTHRARFVIQRARAIYENTIFDKFSCS